MITGNKNNKDQNNSQERNAFILAVVFLVGSLANLILSALLGIQSSTWQMSTQIGIMLLFSMIIIAAIVWMRRGRTKDGIWLIIGGFLFTALGTATLQADLSIILASMTVSLVLITAIFTLPPKEIGRATAISILVAILIFSLDFLELNFRLPTQQNSKIFISATAGILLLASLSLFVQTAFKNYLMRTKLIVALLTSSILTAIIFVAFFFFSDSYSILEEQITNEQQQHLTRHVSTVEQAISSTQVDILYLSQSTNVVQYVRATIGTTDEEEIAFLRDQLDASLLVFAQTHSNYAQLRFIDITGQEISRVDNDREGNSTVTSLSNLQNKSDRYYFEDSIFLPRGEIFMSQLDLNVEHGEIEVPHKPMLRFATPVIISNRTYGEIVLNLYAESFLAPLGETEPFAFLVDQDGYYLYHLDEAKRWGRDLGTEIKLNKDLPELAQAIFLTNKDIGSLRTPEQLFAYKPLTISGESAPRWYLVSYRNTAEAFASLRSVLRLSIFFFLATLLLVAGVAISFSQTITKSLGDLTKTVLEIAKGDLNVIADTQSKDEIGILAKAFNNMTAQLNNMVDTLEQRVTNRTFELEERSSYLETSAKVSKTVAAITESDKIIVESVNLIQQSFDFYYVGLFLVDDQNKWAILQAGTGEAGQIMLEGKHRLEIGKGMIGWSIANAKARIALDVGDDAAHFDNPNLPDTRSEGALPLRSRGRVLGALTVQSVKEAAFTPEIITVLQTMADQIAVALDNAELFAKSEAALKAERRAYGDLSQEDWRALLQRESIPTYFSDAPNEVHSILDQQSQETPQNNPILQDEGLTAIIPIKVRGHILGGVKLRKEKESGVWTKRQLKLAETLAEQVSISLESARLFDQSQRRAARERVIGEISSRMRETLDIEGVLAIAAQEFRNSLGMVEAEVWIAAEDISKNNLK